MPSPSSRWFFVGIHRIDPVLQDQAIVALEGWCKKHAPLVSAQVSKKGSILVGHFQFETRKTADNLTRLLSGVLSSLSESVHLVTHITDEDRWNEKVIAAEAGEEGPRFFYERPAGAAAPAPITRSRWVQFTLRRSLDATNTCTLDEAMIDFEAWCNTHAPLELAQLSKYPQSLVGVLQFEAPKRIDRLGDLLSEALPKLTQPFSLSIKVFETKEEFQDRMNVVAREEAEARVVYTREGTGGASAAPAQAPVRVATAALAARYRGFAEDVLEKSRASVAQVKHDGVVRETWTKTLIAQAGQTLVLKLSEGGTGTLAEQRGAFTNLQIRSETEGVLIHATLRIGSQLIEHQRCITTATPMKPLSLMVGAACVPVRRFMNLEIELEFPQLVDPIPIQVSYDVVTEQLEVDESKIDAKTQEAFALKGFEMPLSESLLRESIFTQQQCIEKEAERDGTSSFYTVPLSLRHPVTQIEAHLPGEVEAAWLLLDYEHHGLHLQKEGDGSSTWKILFESPINFSRVESAKLVYRSSREGSANHRRVEVSAWNLNVARFTQGIAATAFGVPPRKPSEANARSSCDRMP